MSSISIHNVSLDLPIYGFSSRSFRNLFFQKSEKIQTMNSTNENTHVRVLKNLDFELDSGDRVAIVGENGAGKTSLLKVLAGIYAPTSGSLTAAGKIETLFDFGMGLENEATGRENVKIASYYRSSMSPSALSKFVNDVKDFTELEDFFDLPVRTYSTGMKLRLSFAISTCMPVDILLIDEVFGAGDHKFYEKSYARMKLLMEGANILVFSSHNFDLLNQFCNTVIYLRNGEIDFFGSLDEGLQRYQDDIRN